MILIVAAKSKRNLFLIQAFHDYTIRRFRLYQLMLKGYK